MYYSSKNDQTYQIGKWERGKGLYVHKNSTAQQSDNASDQDFEDLSGNSLDLIFQNDSIDPVTLVVVTKEERPYVMLREDQTGNEAYDGFCIDLLKVSVYIYTIEQITFIFVFELIVILLFYIPSFVMLFHNNTIYYFS